MIIPCFNVIYSVTFGSIMNSVASPYHATIFITCNSKAACLFHTWIATGFNANPIISRITGYFCSKEGRRRVRVEMWACVMDMSCCKSFSCVDRCWIGNRARITRVCRKLDALGLWLPREKNWMLVRVRTITAGFSCLLLWREIIHISVHLLRSFRFRSMPLCSTQNICFSKSSCDVIRWSWVIKLVSDDPYQWNVDEKRRAARMIRERRLKVTTVISAKHLSS